MPDLCFLTARELRAALGRREVSAREVLAAHLDQIERLNPAVNAVITLAADQATAAAAAADERAAAGVDLPALARAARGPQGPARDRRAAHHLRVTGAGELRARPRTRWSSSGCGGPG